MEERLIQYKDRTLNLSQWAKVLGISHTALAYRLKRYPRLEQALEPRKRAREQLRVGAQQITYQYQGEPTNIVEIAKKEGISLACAKKRAQRGAYVRLSDGPRCGNCAESGHYAQTCPVAKKRASRKR